MRTILVALVLVACATETPPPERPDAPVAPADASGGVDVAPEAETPPDAPVAPDTQATPDVHVSDVAPLPPPDAGARDASIEVSSDTTANDAGRRCSVASECGTLHPGFRASCRDGACIDVCPPRTGDCDGNIANGCETNTTVNGNCGACGVACRGTCWNAGPDVYRCI